MPKPATAAANHAAMHRQAGPPIMAQAAAWASAPASGSRPSTTLSRPASLNVAAASRTRLQREVMGFVNAGNLGDPSVGYTSWDMSLLSTIIFFGLTVKPGDGSVDTSSTAWQVIYSQTMVNFVNAAHANGARVIVSFDARGDICGQLSPTSTQGTIRIAIQQIQQHNLDGVNIDYEGDDIVCPDGNRARDDMTTFMQSMRAALPNYYISIDTYSGSAEDNLEFFNVTGIAPTVNSFFVMAYDMDYANYAEAPLNCSSYCFNPISPLNTYRFNVTNSMAQYKALVGANKVILGQPYYGRRGCVTTLTDAHQKPLPNTNFVTPTYIYTSTVPSQTGVLNFAAHRDPGDGVSEWDTWYDTDWSCNREQYFDDVTSLGAKYDLINQSDLRGVGFFTLDYGGGSPELWNLIAAKFTPTTPWTSLGGILTSGPGVSSWGASRVDTFARGSDSAIWQDTNNGTTWSSWTKLGGVTTGDPAAVSWSTGRIDMFVRGQDNALWHRYSDGNTWSGWEPLGGGLNAGPSVASWAPQRLDIFVVGTDNALWHRYWNGSGWSGWQSLGGSLTSKPSVAAWGSNRLDIFARGTDLRMYHMDWSGSQWTGWEPLGGVFMSGPGAASCVLGHLDVYAVGLDHGLWRESWTGNGWSGWAPQGGRWVADPGAACVPSTTNEDVFELGIDSAVWETTFTAS